MSNGDPLDCVVIGAGALGLGFIGSELAGACRLTFLDIPAKADFLQCLRESGEYVYNQSGLSMRPATVAGVTAHCLGGDSADKGAGEALQTADMVFTAVGESNLHHLAPALAEVALARDSQNPLRILCGENGVDIAKNFGAALEQAAGEPLAARVRVGDTVMGRMCKLVSKPADPLHPVAPGQDFAVVAEPFYGIPAEAHVLDGLEGLPHAIEPQAPPAFSASEDVKMLCHNGLHAVLAALGYLEGVEYFDELREHGHLTEAGRRLLAEEAVPALLSKHADAMDRNRLLNYADWILRRVTCPVLHDPLQRGLRGAMRKLQPWERLVYSVRTVLEQGGRPRVYADGLAGMAIAAWRTGQTELSFQRVITERCGIQPDADAELFEIITEAGERLGAEA